MPPARSLPELLAFIQGRTRAAPVPLVPEIALYQATELTPLWQATTAELEGWDPAPFWAFPWAGGQAVARHVLDHPELVAGKRVFDFATGSGLVGLAAVKAGASSVLACDLDPFCAAAVQLNAGLNGLEMGFRAGDPLGEALEGFEVVLAGDVFYERRLAEESLSWLARLAARGVLALAGDPGRLYSPQRGMRERACYDVPTSAEIERDVVLQTSVLEILPAPPA